MNWLIWEKIFTYFYNKFRRVNRMHFIKCGVNISLRNSGCCTRSLAPWIAVLSWHTVFTKRVTYYRFTFLRCSMKKGTMHRPTSHLVRCVPFLWPREEHRWSIHGLVILLAIVCCGDFCWGLLLLLLLFLFFFFLKIVFHVASLCIWFPKSVSATRISLLASSLSFIYFFWPFLRYPQSSALFRLLCMSCRNIIPVRYKNLLQWQQNRSKATMWLLCKIPHIWGCQSCY